MGREFTYEENDTVFYWSGNKFYVLYDFSARIGDKWTIFSNASNPCGDDTLGTVQVDSIITREINGISVKEIYTKVVDSSIWGYSYLESGVGSLVQVIGARAYMFPSFYNTCNIVDYTGSPGPLRCYEDSLFGLVKFTNRSCDTLIRYTSIDKRQYSDGVLLAYPNPVENILNVEHVSALIADVELFDTMNRRVYQQNGNFNSANISMADFASGVYLLKIKDKKGNISVKKIIKK